MPFRDLLIGPPKRLLRRYAQRQDGSITLLGVLLLMAMLVMGGMAVDFMRFETERARLQSVADRATLAAANSLTDVDAVALIRDYFRAEGLEHALVGQPSITPTELGAMTEVSARVDVNTFFLRMVGIDTLTPNVTARAQEIVEKTEISLVLSISPDMARDNQFANMQDAAIAFANMVLRPANRGYVSLNIIPYAGQTNPSTQMFDYLQGVRYNIGADGIYGTADDQAFPQVSSCLEMSDGDFATTGLPGAGRAQVNHFQILPLSHPTWAEWGWCPQERAAIRHAVSDPATAEAVIRNLRIYSGSGLQYAMKYALALLDPTSQPAFAHLNSISTTLVPTEFTDRPSAWLDPQTRKVIVILSDGEIGRQVRPANGLDPANLDTWLDWQPWTTTTYWLNDRGNSAGARLFDNLCTLAKSPSHNIEIYTIGFNNSFEGQNWQRQLRNCASHPSMFFPTNGLHITYVFQVIADRLNRTRLTQ